MDTLFRWFQRGLCVLYGFGASVHAGNLLGLGKYELAQMPGHWIVADGFYLGMNVATVIGLWQNAHWGRICLLVMLGTQLVIYLGFPAAFAETDAERAQIRGMVWLHIGTLVVLSVLWALAARATSDQAG